MDENVKNPEVENSTETVKNKVIVAYTIKRYENGDIDIENAENFEDTTQLSNEALYKDVEEVAEMIKYKRIENASYRGIVRFYEDVARREAQQQAAQTETAE